MPGWRGCPRAPWNTNRHLRTQETAPYPAAELPKRLQGPWLDPEQLGGARAAAPHGGGCEARSSWRGLQQRKRIPAERAAGQWDQLRGARAAAPRRRLCGREGESNSAGTGAQGARTQPRIWPPPGTGRAREGPRQLGRFCPELSRSASPPWHLQALQRESSIVTVGAESRAPELPASLGWFLLGPHGLNNPH